MNLHLKSIGINTSVSMDMTQMLRNIRNIDVEGTHLILILTIACSARDHATDAVGEITPWNLP